MTTEKKKELILDPELIMKRKFRAKCRFRAIARLALANAYWLAEDMAYEGDDVKRRVEQAVRAKKKKQLLTTADKALLNKPAEDRTEQEKKYIYRIIGGLKCFKSYPNNVKRKLAASTYFIYYGPNRVIMRHHHPPLSMFFIVTGKVSISRLVYDELLKQDVPVEIAQLGPGDMFGEVSLFHNVPRTATATTIEHCEFLSLMGDDFKDILQATVQRQWDEVRKAMSNFSYFDALDEVARREGCIVAKLKGYDPNDTVLGDGQGVPNHVYFILSGRVQMIETLKIFVTSTGGHTYYSLHDTYVPPPVESELDIEKKYFLAYKNLIKNRDSTENSTSGIVVHRKSVVAEHRKSVVAEHRKSVIAEHRKSIMRKPDAIRKSSVHIVSNQQRLSSQMAQKRSSKSSATKTSDGNVKSKNELKTQRISIVDMKSDTKRISSEMEISIEEKNNSNVQESEEAQTCPESRDILAPLDSDYTRPSIRFSTIPGEETLYKMKNLKTYFMQVCQLSAGASFGLGENMRDRRIIALTPVICLLLPKVWLLQRNTANIWTRIQHYLEKKIPTKKQLFGQFLRQRQWEEYRGMLVDDIVATSKAVNYTSVHDVPYSIRLEEMCDL